MLLLTLLSTLALGQSITLVDLSHNLDNRTLSWPGMPTWNRSDIFTGHMSHGGVWVSFGEYYTAEHGGTHMDAPLHYSPDGLDLSEIPLEMTVTPGVHIDVSGEIKADGVYQLTLERVKDWEKEHGPIPQKAAVLVNFGWSSRWPDPVAYFNSDTPDNVTSWSIPFVNATLTEYLVDVRNINTLGTDTATPDSPQTTTYPNHVTLLPKNRMILENLAIPSSLPATGFTVHSAPIKIVDGTGVQTRVYAILEENAATNVIVSAYAMWMVGVVIILRQFI